MRIVENGERFTIIVRGEPKAEVVPVQSARPTRSPEEIDEAYMRLKNPRIAGVSHETIREWIEEGRP